MIWPASLVVFCLLATTLSASSTKINQTKMAATDEYFGKLPLLFEVNRGQGDSETMFITRTGGYTLNLRKKDAAITFNGSRGSAATLRINFVRSHIPQVEGLQFAPTQANYYLGSQANKWIVGVPTYYRVRYRGVYRGIDVEFYGRENQVEYDFVVAPGSDPRKIRLQFSGATSLALGKNGELLLQTSAGTIKQLKPVAYQRINGSRRSVAASYVLHANNTVSFSLGGFDRRRTLVIDPVIVFSSYATYIRDAVMAMDVTSGGNAFVVGHVIQSNQNNIVVTKLNTSGTAAIYQTTFGGSDDDAVQDMVVDSSGNAYIGGYTQSLNFPTTSGAFSRTRRGFDDNFVTKLNASGQIAYATLMGGNSIDHIFAIALDSSRNIYATGVTLSTDYPTTSGAFDRTLKDREDSFVTKLNSSGSALVYSTYLGSDIDNNDGGFGIAVDGSGNAYVVGRTGPGYPTTPGAYRPATTTVQDAFAAKLNSSGSGLIYATYLGANQALAVAVDELGAAYVTGNGPAPTTPGAFHEGDDVFVTKLNPSGSAAEYSLNWGFTGSASHSGEGIAVDATGAAYVTGFGFPAYIAKFNPTGTDREFHHGIGGSTGRSVAMDGSGRVYVAGFAFGQSPVRTTPFAYRQSGEGFAFKLAPVCTISDGPQSKICTPANGSTVPSPLRFVGGSTSPNGLRFQQIYIDRIKALEPGFDQIDMQIPMKAGTRRITLQAKDNAGVLSKHTINVNISGGCTLSSADPAVTICLPKNNSTASSLTRVVAAANSSHPVKLLQIYVNGTKRDDFFASILDTFISLTKGTNRVTVQAKDAAGRTFKSTVFVPVP